MQWYTSPLAPLGNLVPAPRLFLVHLDDIVLLHLQRLRGLVVVDAPSVEEEPANDKVSNGKLPKILQVLTHRRLVTGTPTLSL